MTNIQDKLAALRAKIKDQKSSNPVGVEPANAPSIVEPPKQQSILTEKSNLPFELLEKVSSLESALLDRHPRMPGLLGEIFKALKAQPENVTLMNEEEIRVVVECLKVQTGVQFAEKVTKSKSGNAKFKSATTEMF